MGRMLPCADLRPKYGSPSVGLLLCLAAARAFAVAGLWLIAVAAACAQMQLVPGITAVAGTGAAGYSGDNGLASSAKLDSPADVAFDSAGNWYIADYTNCRIRKVTIATAVISTVAGNGTCGYNSDAIAATSAELNGPNSVAIDSFGNIYIADYTNNRIRKVTISTGYISTVAGTGTASYSGDGAAATSAALDTPSGVAVDSSGNIYIADRTNDRVRKVTISTGYISTVAGNGSSCSSPAGGCGDGSAATSANLTSPNSVALDSSGNIYIADSGDNRIREVTISTGNISTVAGNGTPGYSGDGGAATSAEIDGPNGAALDSSGNIYISDTQDRRIRVVNPGTGHISTLAGNGTQGATGNGGPATSAELDDPKQIAVDGLGNVYLADATAEEVRLVQLNTTFPATALGSSSAVQDFFLETTSAETLTSMTAQQSQGSKQEYSIGTITGCTVNGSTSNPSGTICTLPITFTPAYPGPRNVPLTAVTGTGKVGFGLTGTGAGPLALLIPGIVSTVAGNGTAGTTGNGGAATSAELNDPGNVAVDSAGNMYIANYNNQDIQKVTASSGNISIVAGNGTSGYSGDGSAATSAEFKHPSGLGIDSAGNIYIADKNNCRIRKVTVATGVIATVAGNGTCSYTGDGGLATSAEIHNPSSNIAFDSSGNWYFGDIYNYRVREVNASTGIITTVAGNGTAGYSGDGGAATSAEIDNPSGVALDSSGNIYISDSADQVIRKVTVSTGIISTVAGTGTYGYSGDGGPAIDAKINNPGGLAVDPAGNIYIADNNNNRIRVVNAASGTISTVAGNGTGGYAGDGGSATAAELNIPADIALDSAGNMYIGDSSNNVIRKVNVSQSQLTYPTSTAVGTMDGSDDPQTATVANNGNASVTFSVPGTGNNPSVSAYFELDNATTCPELNTSSSPATLAAGQVCNYAVDFAPTIAGAVSGSVIVTDNSLGVTGATQTISLIATATKGTPPISWSNPAAITYGTALSSTQLDASSTLSGTFVYSPFSGTVLSAGSQTLSVTFNPTDTTDYNSGTDNVTLTVNPAAPTITFTVSNQTYGVSPFTVSASSNSAGVITYSVVSGPATISGSTVTITGAGAVVLQASQAASGNYSAGTQNASFTVAQATKTITFPQPTTPVTVNGTATLGATASGGDPVTYSITAGTASISGSTITYTNAGTVTIAANSAATANYTAAATVSDTVTVNAAASAYTAPATNVGSTSATQTATVNIATAGTLGTISVLTQGAASLDYAYTIGGTCAAGTAYSVGQACTVEYTFTPTAPGLRLGAVVLSTSTPTVLGRSYLVGSGTGPRGTFPPGIISTIAGNGTAGYSGDGGQAASAEVNQPRDVALDAAGNLYISDTSNSCVRKINTSGVISTYAGTCASSGSSGNGGAATSAKLSSPGGIALDGAGNLYIADQNNNVVREVNAVTGFISIVAGNMTSGYNGDNVAATSAELNGPQFVMTDSAGNFYISDVGNARVREVTIATGIITTIVGNGTGGYNGDGIAATSAETNSPGRLAFDASGNLYIPEKANNRVRMVSAATGLISTVAGTGTQTFSGDGGAATSANLNQPLSAMLDGAGNLYIADYGNSRIREVNATTQIINTIAGNYTAGGYSGDGGPATSAELNTPIGTTMTPGANIYIADYRNNRIRLVTQSTPAAMSLPSTAYGATSAASYQTVQNTGNGTLTIASISSSSGNFTLGGASATCANSSQLLASAAACVLGVEFTPTSVASLNGTITVTDNTLNVSSSTQTIAVSGTGVAAAPAITFTVSNQTYGLSPFTVSATSNSAGAITYSVVSGPATISGSTVTITGIGTVVLQASQAANGNYSVGTQNATFTVSAAAPTITFTVSNQTYGVAPFTVSATSNSAGAITYSVVSGPATISGSTVTITGVGTVVLQASQAANGNYTVGTQNASFTVSAAAPTITFTVSNQTYGVSPFTVSATSNSAGTITYSVVSGPASISGATVTITGIGTVVLQAVQAANGNYTAGTQNASFTVSKATPTVALSSSSNPSTYSGSVTFTATVPPSATGIVTFLDGATSIGTGSVSSGAATFTMASLSGGSHSITAQYGGNSNYNAATSSAVTEVVDRTPVTVSIISTENPSIYWDMVTFTFTFTGSGSAIPTGTATITEDGNALTTVTLDGTGKATYSTSATTAGSHNIKAAYNGDDNYQ
jgi:sugar lactone lactonase YvrE